MSSAFLSLHFKKIIKERRKGEGRKQETEEERRTNLLEAFQSSVQITLREAATPEIVQGGLHERVELAKELYSYSKGCVVIFPCC